MSHYQRKLNADFPMQITGRTNNKENFPIPLGECWEIFGDYLHLLHSQYAIRIRMFLMMSNHFHLICRDPEGNLSKGMAVFMRETSKEMSRMSGRINRVWGSRFHSTIIDNPRYFLYAYKYNYRNPVAAGICMRVEDYPWSTLQMLLGNRGGIIPIEDDNTLFDNVEGTLSWLNEEYKTESADAIKSALARKKFVLPKIKETRRLVSIE